MDWQVELPAPSPPSAAGVAVSLHPGTGAKYGLGGTIRIRLMFSEVVAVRGSLRLKIDMEPGRLGREVGFPDDSTCHSSRGKPSKITLPSVSGPM